jgi:hypothetical protein
MKIYLVMLFLLCVTLGHSQPGSNTKYFDIKWAGVKIGELKATRTIKDSITWYWLESNVKLWLVVSIEMQHRLETVYHGKRLFSSNSVSRTNNGTYTSSVAWKNGYYQTNVDSYKYKNSNPIHETLECNVARFYFDEPVNIDKTLADAYGTLASVKRVNPGNYEVDSQGTINKYQYENGTFVRASIYSNIRYEVVARNDGPLSASE